MGFSMVLFLIILSIYLYLIGLIMVISYDDYRTKFSYFLDISYPISLPVFICFRKQIVKWLDK